MRWLTGLLLLEGAIFIAASLVHRGILVHGYEHDRAAVAETVIGTVLLAATALAWLLPARRAIGVGAQAFALLGTIVGLFTIVVGIGPRTAPDLAYHGSMLALLLAGLVFTARAAPSS